MRPHKAYKNQEDMLHKHKIDGWEGLLDELSFFKHDVSRRAVHPSVCQRCHITLIATHHVPCKPLRRGRGIAVKIMICLYSHPQVILLKSGSVAEMLLSMLDSIWPVSLLKENTVECII